MGYYKNYYCEDDDLANAKVIKFTDEDRQILKDLTNINILEDLKIISKYLVHPCIIVREAAQVRYNELLPRVSSKGEVR